LRPGANNFTNISNPFPNGKFQKERLFPERGM
jgi:hypothetical protein